MKIYFNTILGLTLTIVFTACGSELYTKKELRTQIVPEALKGKIWTLRKIYSEKILDSSMTDEFNNSNGTKNCSFTFQFADKGELIMTFKEHKFRGVYLVGTQNTFKFLFSGFREKIVWTTNPECKITPTQLGYVFNRQSEVQFKIEGDTLTLQNTTGDNLVLTANSN
jgi:hypothetical protein